MIVLCTGSRHLNDSGAVWPRLDAELAADPQLIVVVGYDPDSPKDQGLDQRVYEWAKARRVPVMCHPARWDLYGNPAGPKRNGRMVSDARPRKCLRWPGGRGTANCAAQADASGIRVEEVNG